MVSQGEFYVTNRRSIRPSTDDATIDANVVHVASAVGGRIIELAAAENAKVSKGDLLFRIDPEPYRLAVEQAEADLGVALGALDTRRRAIVTEKSNATIAREQIKRAQANLELATRTAERLQPALSHYQIEYVANLLARRAHAAATTSRHVCRADALKARCVLAEVRWRWTLKVLWAAACTERNLCADPTLLNPCILRSRRRVG